MPLDMPREDYAAPAMYTLSYIARVLRFLVYGVVGISAAGLMTYEGMHMWIENVALGAPSGPIESSSSPASSPSSSSTTPTSTMSLTEEDYGWQEENASWTGGSKGGTDSRLGYKGRHALRAAWICKEIGAGGAGSIGSGRGGHGSRTELAGMIGTGSSGSGVSVNTIDRGFELAEEYIDVAIGEAKRKGLVFPPNLPGARSGPAYLTNAEEYEKRGNGVSVDQAAVDLLLLKAGILERISTHDSLLHAKELYEQVLASNRRTAGREATDVRLASKIGDLECKTGGNGMGWWEWALKKAQVDVVIPQMEQRVEGVHEAEVVEERGWFGRKTRTTKKSSQPSLPLPSVTTLPPTSSPTPSAHMSPGLLRAAISTLVSAEAHLAQIKDFAAAVHIQDLALSLIPSPSSATISSSARPSPGAALHDLWLSHRRALLTLHKASVTHALRQPALDLATSSTNAAEAIIPSMPAIPSGSNVLHQSIKLLHRDALLLAAEAQYTKALLLEKQVDNEGLDAALEGFQRAMTLSTIESGGEEGIKGEEWARYWRGYARIRERMDRLTEK